MPAPDSLRPPTETLANGLQVTLRHAPGLKRSAAVLRVEAAATMHLRRGRGWRTFSNTFSSWGRHVFPLDRT